MANDRKFVFGVFFLLLLFSFVVSFSRVRNPSLYSLLLEKVLGIAVILFLLFSIGMISMAKVKNRLQIHGAIGRKRNANPTTALVRLMKDIIISSVLAVISISAVYLSIRDFGYVGLVIAAFSGLLVVFEYLSLDN